MSHLSHLSQVDRVSFVLLFSDRVYQRFASMGGGLGPAAPVPAAAPLPPVRAASASQRSPSFYRQSGLHLSAQPVARAGPRKQSSRQDRQDRAVSWAVLPGRAHGHSGALLLLVAADVPSARDIERMFSKAHAAGAWWWTPAASADWRRRSMAALAAVISRCRVPVRQDLGLVTCDRPSV